MKEEILIRSFNRELCSCLKEYLVKEDTDYGYCDIRIPSKGPAFDFIKKEVEENNKLPLRQQSLIVSAWKYVRKYKKEEFDSSNMIFQIIPCKQAQTSGEEHGTKYDYSESCPICHSGRRLIGNFRISRKSVLKSANLFQTYGGELITDDSLKTSCNNYGIKGIEFCKTSVDGYYLTSSSKRVNISNSTEFGCSPFDKAEYSDEISFSFGNIDSNKKKEIYKCPNGDNLGLNILSEAFIEYDNALFDVDFIQSAQYVGVHRGFLYQMPLYFCSQKFRRMVETEKLKGIKFEVAHIVERD